MYIRSRRTRVVNFECIYNSHGVKTVTHTEMTTLSQPWHKVATMLFYNLVTTLAQPCILKLSQGCPNSVTRLPQCNLVTTLAQPCILKLSQGCDKVVARLSQGCTNIVTSLPQCTLSQPCILKLWRLQQDCINAS